MAFLSPWSTFEWLLVAPWDTETLKQWMSVFFYFSWQLPHLDRGNGGLPAELQQTPGPTQRAHPATAPGTLFISLYMSIKQHEASLCVGFTIEVWVSVGGAVISGYHCSFCCTLTYCTSQHCAKMSIPVNVTWYRLLNHDDVAVFPTGWEFTCGGWRGVWWA